MMGAGQSGGFLPFVDNFDRADGDLAGGWTYSEGVWTINGGILSVAPVLGSEELSNANMEAGNPPTGWDAAGGATLSAVADERTGGCSDPMNLDTEM